jgi:hypothetical protein
MNITVREDVCKYLTQLVKIKKNAITYDKHNDEKLYNYSVLIMKVIELLKQVPMTFEKEDKIFYDECLTNKILNQSFFKNAHVSNYKITFNADSLNNLLSYKIKNITKITDCFVVTSISACLTPDAYDKQKDFNRVAIIIHFMMMMCKLYYVWNNNINNYKADIEMYNSWLEFFDIDIIFDINKRNLCPDFNCIGEKIITKDLIDVKIFMRFLEKLMEKCQKIPFF